MYHSSSSVTITKGLGGIAKAPNWKVPKKLFFFFFYFFFLFFFKWATSFILTKDKFLM